MTTTEKINVLNGELLTLTTTDNLVAYVNGNGIVGVYQTTGTGAHLALVGGNNLTVRETVPAIINALTTGIE